MDCIHNRRHQQNKNRVLQIPSGSRKDYGIPFRSRLSCRSPPNYSTRSVADFQQTNRRSSRSSSRYRPPRKDRSSPNAERRPKEPLALHTCKYRRLRSDGVFSPMRLREFSPPESKLFSAADVPAHDHPMSANKLPADGFPNN